MAFDNSTLLTQIAQEIVDSLRNDEPSFDEMACTVRTTDAISGSIPYLAAADTLGKDLGASAIGSDPTPIDMNLSSVAYECVRYAHSIAMDRSEVQDLDQYANTFGEVAATLREYNKIAREADLAALLTDSNNVGQHAVGNGAWSASTSTPVIDLQEAKRQDCPNVDTVILGRTSADELARHEDITARFANYASGMSIGYGMLKSVIAEILGVQASNVLIWDTFYNSGAFGQSAALAYVTGDFCLLYEKSQVLKVSQNGNNDVATVETSHMKVETAVSDTCDYLTVAAGANFRATEITGL
jgi:hypothetical protein